MTVQADQERTRRQASAAPGGARDRLIRFLAGALPAGVGVVAAVMILAPLGPRGEISFLLDRNKVTLTQDRLRVDHAMYRGSDDRGRPFSLNAASALQHSASVPTVELQGIMGRILLDSGPAEISAQDGSYDISNDKIAVRGSVDFRAADGYRMVTRGVTIDKRTRRIMGAGGVDGAIPAGTFSADRIVADLGARTIALDGHARLRMAPGKLRIPS